MFKLKKLFETLAKTNRSVIQKKFEFGLREHGGRNNTGRRIFRRASMTKRNYRFVDFKRNCCAGIVGQIVQRNIYDPNRTAFLSLILFLNGVSCYILATQYITGQKNIYNLSIPQIKKEVGWSNYLQRIPAGSIINTIERILIMVVFLHVVLV